MLAFGIADAFWYIVAGVGLAIAVAFVASVRTCFRWLGRRLKRAYLDWFAEAIDEHVEPKFAQVRQETTAAAAEVKQNSLRAAAEIKREALETAQIVKEELYRHTQEEGMVVRAIVSEEVAPIKAILDSRTVLFEHLETTLTDTQAVLADHMTHDEQMTEAATRALEAGQQALIAQLAAQHESMEAKFTSLEQSLEKP